MSRLNTRLNQLRRQAGVTEGPPRAPLAERLQRRRPAEHSELPHKQSCGEAEVAVMLNGEVIAPGVIVADKTVPLVHRHGVQALNELPTADITHLDEAQKGRVQGMVFMDTETTGLAGGTGTLVFLLGLARLNGQELRLRQYFLTGFGGEAAMLEHAAQWLEGAETVVTYNGKCFDAPLLATRYRLAGRADPFAPLPHLDLLYATRRAFAKVWPDCCLKTAEQRLLGFSRTDDLPGAEAPMVWFEFVRFGITARLRAVLEHNFWDLVSLAALVPALAETYQRPDEAGASVLSLARHRLRQGDAGGAYGLLSAQRSNLSREGLLELAAMHRRRREWDAAAAIWRPLAEEGCMESLERLAKYYEHVERDYVRALGLTQRLIAAAGEDVRYQRRRGRLLGKLGVSSG